MRGPVAAAAIAGAVGLLLINGCRDPQPGAAASTGPLLPTPNGVVMYVNPTNCRFTTRDAERLNALGRRPALSVRVVFVGLLAGDTATVRRLREDLDLHVPVSLADDAGVPPWPGEGRARLPMIVVVKEGEPRTVVTGEDVTLAIDLVERSLGLDPS